MGPIKKGMCTAISETWIKLPAFSRKAGLRDNKVQLALQMVQVYLNFKEQRPEREDSATAYLDQINISDWSEMLRCDSVFLEVGPAHSY